MKNVFFCTALFLAFFATANSASAQNQAYWENLAKKALVSTDRTINHYNKQTKSFTPRELQMMRNNDPRFIQIANRKTQRMDATQRQYQSHYNKQWARSFNTFNRPQYKHYGH